MPFLLLDLTFRRGLADIEMDDIAAMSGHIDKSELISKLQTLEGLTNDERSNLIGLLRQHKKYGLVWEDKPEDVEERLREELPVLREVKDKAIPSSEPDAPNHILIEGDNLEALTALCYTHEGKIDVIYIDPPYNTGNKDFAYYDDFEDEYRQVPYVDKEDSYRHSKWLSFMSKRLKVAKRLLSEKGIIFISIDDNEQANLKLLCDEIFVSRNFINCVSIKAKSSSGASGGGEDKKLKKNIEYLLIYAKDIDSIDLVFPIAETPLFELIQEKQEQGITWSYTNVMTDFGQKHYVTSTQAGNGEEIKIYEVSNYRIESVSSLATRLGKTEENIYNEYIDRIFTTENAQTSIRQRVADAVRGDGLYIAEYVPVSGRNKGKVTEVGFIGTTKRLVSYLKNTCTIRNGEVFKREKIGTLWADLSWSAVSKEGGVAFPAGKKPISLIERAIGMIPRNDITVLDFFAGSGSTGHATMSLNSKDEGSRKFIIATNNENQICEEKTYPRCWNVINGYGRNLGLKANTLRYYKTDFIPRERTQKNMRALVAAATDLLCIKEDLYEEQKTFGRFKLKPQLARYFNNGKKHVLIIYREELVEEIAEEIKTLDFGKMRLKIYVFSPGRYAFADNFYEVEDKVELVALPAAIYDAYQKVLPKRKEKLFEEEKTETIFPKDLFAGQEEGGEQ